MPPFAQVTVFVLLLVAGTYVVVRLVAHLLSRSQVRRRRSSRSEGRRGPVVPALARTPAASAAVGAQAANGATRSPGVAETGRIVSSTNMIMELVRGYLDADELNYRVDEDHGAVECGFRGEAALYALRIATAGEPVTLGVIVRVPLVVPEARRAAMAETCTRINHGLLLGAFDLHMSEGLLRFRSSVPIGDGTLTRDQFSRLLYTSMATVDRYFKAFARLLYGDDLSPAEVVAEIEMADD
ncbi:MAG: YbjN domain-containing protein [Phycisphaerales bacterium]|nr:YbjN domain-containing protein [Phycisphaerales bacterium]